MRKFFLCLLTFMLLVMSTKAQEYNFEDYFYPSGFRTYITPVSGNEAKTLCIKQYSFISQSFGNYLVEETYIGDEILSAQNYYKLHTEGNAVVSDVQIMKNPIMGSRRFQDRLILFAFPKNGVPYKWTEINDGEKGQCTSEYVYINYSIHNKKSYGKAVKIKKVVSYVSGNKMHRVIETSYWVRNCGRIITYENSDGQTRTSSKLDALDYVKEISKEEYNKNKRP